MERPPETVSRRRHAETLLLLAALVLVAYAGSFTAGFAFDNRPLILESGRVHAVSLANLKQILVHDYWWPVYNSGLYRPLSTLSYLFNYAVLGGGDEPFGYHAVNLLLHAANAFLVYLLVFHLVRRYRTAVLAAALWALHPICTEAVTNIIGRAEELAALGVLGALLLYIRAKEESGRRKVLCLAGVSAFTLLAVFSKENGVMAAALVVLYDAAFGIPRGSSLREAVARLRQFLREGYLYLAIPIALMLAARWEVLRRAGPVDLGFVDNPLLGADLATRWAMVVRVTGKYLGLLLWPRTLSADYSYNQVPLLSWYSANWRDGVAAAALLGLVLAAAWSYRRRRVGFFLIGFAALAYLPASNLLVTTGTILGERLLYLPAVGFAAAVAVGVDRLAQRLRWRPAAAMAVLGAVGLAYGARTYRRNADWQDDETLFGSAVEAAPASFKAHLALADALLAKDPRFLEGERAIEEAEKGAAIVAGLPPERKVTRIYVRLAAVYLTRGDSLARPGPDGLPLPDPAPLAWYRKALDAALQGVEVDRAQNENHRRAELARGTPPERIELYEQPDLYANLGLAYLRLGETARAVEAFDFERRLDPGAWPAYLNLASAAIAGQQSEAAARFLLESLLLHDSPEAIARLAEVYGGIPGGDCAIAGRGEDPSVNRDCPAVKRDLCDGYRDLQTAFREAKRELPKVVSGCR